MKSFNHFKPVVKVGRPSRDTVITKDEIISLKIDLGKSKDSQDIINKM